MPFYTLKCNDCGHRFEALASIKEREEKNSDKFNCPECKSKNTTFKFSLPNLFRGGSSSGGCCPGGGKGCCS